jgi:hypothetical protein
MDRYHWNFRKIRGTNNWRGEIKKGRRKMTIINKPAGRSFAGGEDGCGVELITLLYSQYQVLQAGTVQNK